MEENWIYIPATEEEKIPVHPTVLTYKTSEGRYVSIKDLPRYVLNNAIGFMVKLKVLENEYGASILGDSWDGEAGFAMSNFCFTWYNRLRVIVTADNHIVGEIRHKTFSEDES